MSDTFTAFCTECKKYYEVGKIEQAQYLIPKLANLHKNHLDKLKMINDCAYYECFKTIEAIYKNGNNEIWNEKDEMLESFDKLEPIDINIFDIGLDFDEQLKYFPQELQDKIERENDLKELEEQNLRDTTKRYYKFNEARKLGTYIKHKNWTQFKDISGCMKLLIENYSSEDINLILDDEGWEAFEK